MPINYVVDDATFIPEGPGIWIIPHVCNNEVKWGSGFVLALNARWKSPESIYRARAEDKLGEVQYVQVEPAGKPPRVIVVANMIAMNGLKSESNPTPLDYKALDQCLNDVKSYIRIYYRYLDPKTINIKMPRIGCDRGGGDWQTVEKLIEDRLGQFNVLVCDLPKES